MNVAVAAPHAGFASGGRRWPWMLLLVFFMPGHWWEWSVEWGWVGIIALIGVCHLFITPATPPLARLYSDRTWMRFGLVLTVLTATGGAYAAFRFGIPLGLRDFVDFPRYLVYGMIGMMIARNVDLIDPDVIDKAIRALVAFNLICSAVILLDVPLFNSVLLAAYEGAKLQYEGGYVRIGIPFPNPNFAALSFMFCLAYFVFFRQSALFALCSFVAILLTGSRSGMVASLPILGLGYVLVLVQFAGKRNWKVGLALFISHFLLAYFYTTIATAVEGLNRLQEVVEALEGGGLGSVNTARIRNEVTQALIQDFVLRSPVFGWGPGKSIGIDVSDSQYTNWLLLFGVPGMILAVAFFSGMLIPLLRSASRFRTMAGALAVTLSFAIILYTGDFMKNYRLYFIVVYFLHVMLRETRERAALDRGAAQAAPPGSATPRGARAPAP
jgi:hypothetical protein